MQENNRDEYRVPESFLFAPFYTKREVFEVFDHCVKVEEVIKKEPFYFDMLHLLNAEVLTVVPWNCSEVFVPFVIEQWKELKPQLYAVITKRKINKSAIVHSLSLFVLCLFWTNETSVKSLHVKDMRVYDLKYKPVNCEERLMFVFQNPTQYHSFIQLQQLFDELEKIYYKAKAVKQSINEKGMTT